jgi:hypothetical protein
MRNIIAAGLLAGGLSACAASGSIQTTSTAPIVDSTLAASVDVQTPLPNKGDSAAALRNAIAAQLVNKKAFRAVTDNASSDYLLRVTVTDVHEVGQGARILLGALAGQASITASCEVVDRKQDKVIGSMTTNAKSSGGHIFAGTTQEAIDVAATQIVDYLLQNRKL